MKKSLLIIIVSILAATLIGCSIEDTRIKSIPKGRTAKVVEVKNTPTTTDNETTQQENVTQNKETKEIKDLKIGFAQSGTSTPWHQALEDNMEDEMKKQGVTYISTNANNDLQIHSENIIKMLEQDLDYLVITPDVETGLESALEQAAKANIPVIAASRSTAGEYVTAVYSDQVWEGERCAEILGEIDPTAKIVEMRGTEGASAVTNRAKGFRTIMNQFYPDMEIIHEETANFSYDEAQKAIVKIIEKQGAENIDAVYAHSDSMALGVIQGIKEAGLTPGKDIKIIGIDGQKEALDAIIAGEMLASVQCSPMMAPTIFDVIESLNNGETVQKETIVPDKIFTIENAADSYDYAF